MTPIEQALRTWPGRHGWKLRDFYSRKAIRELAEFVGTHLEGSAG